MNPPLGLCYLSTALKLNTAYLITGVDLDLGDPIKPAIMYGIYCMTPQYESLVNIIREIKIISPGALIVVGGPHATSCPRDCLDAGADIAVRGPGELVILDIVKNGKREPIIDGTLPRSLDLIPFPDRDLFRLNRYHRTLNQEPAIHIVTLRGCPFQCAFCDKQSVGKTLHLRSVKNVMDEMDFLIRRYGTKKFVTYDDIFTLSHKRVRRFCAEFQARDIQWRCWARADTIDPPLLCMMKASGLASITLGIESGDDAVLTRIKKGVTARQNKDALLACRKAGVPVRCSLMFGNPGETRKSLENTVRMVAETLPDEWNLSVLTPIPGSDIWKHPLRYGLDIDKKTYREDGYKKLNRFEMSGVGKLTFAHPSVNETDLEWFIQQLEMVCPRRKIQDTIQEINDVDITHAIAA